MTLSISQRFLKGRMANAFIASVRYLMVITVLTTSTLRFQMVTTVIEMWLPPVTHAILQKAHEQEKNISETYTGEALSAVRNLNKLCRK